jgi:hypothetical protein
VLSQPFVTGKPAYSHQVTELPGFVFVHCESAAACNSAHFVLIDSEMVPPGCLYRTLENYRTGDFLLIVGKW